MSVEKYYSYFKNIYIELQDYTFEHNPSDHKQTTSRFIGRKKLIERIKNVLNSSSTRSGAYLVTGFRGIGKSSLLNKVISDLEPEFPPRKFRNRTYRLVFFSVVMATLTHWLYSNDLIKPEFINNSSYLWIAIAIIWLRNLANVYNSIARFLKIKHRQARKNWGLNSVCTSIWILILTLPLWIIDLPDFNSGSPWVAYFLTAIATLIFLSVYNSTQKNENLNLSNNTSVQWHTLRLIKVLSAFNVKREKYTKASSFYLKQDLLVTIVVTALINFLSNHPYTKELLPLTQSLSHSILIFFIGGVAIIFSTKILILVIRPCVNTLHLIEKKCHQCRSFWELIVSVFYLLSRLLRTSFQEFLKTIFRIVKTPKPIQRFFTYIKNRHTYSRRFHNRINLGHDELTEIDILKAIARSIQSSYKNINSLFWAFPYGLLIRVTRLAILLFVLSSLYLIKNVKTATDNFKVEVGYYNAFPSQLDTTLRRDSVLRIQSELILESSRHQIAINSVISNDNGTLTQFWSSISSNLLRATVYADQVFKSIYCEFIKQFPIVWIRTFEKKKNFSQFRLFPETPDYLFIFIYVITFWLSKRIFRTQPFGLITHSGIIARLSTLNDRINAHVHKESVSGLGFFQSYLNIFKKNSKVYPIADAREIETELIDILKDIEKIPPILSKPEFVFIFDELDKIEIHHNSSIIDKEEELSKLNESPRDRRMAILKILANLKHFFTTADAKFIFIAGREMYDAHLADISDRNYFLGSIFHDVIYVPSFLTDSSEQTPDSAKSPDHMSYHTNLVEEFVCQKIIPRDYSRDGKSWSLKTFNKYLQDEFLPPEKLIKNSNKREEYEENIEFIRHQIDQTILTLRNFINYLQYRSSGAPKKMSFLLESYIYSFDEEKIYNREVIRDETAILFGKRRENFYLRFTYFDCYSFSLNNYLTTPFLHNISRQINDYSDKLMVSTTYILDHIYKFHSSGFSWRNLEVTPEIIDINKAPSLRKLISDIITFLLYYHLEHVVSGLYDFKFNSRLSIELDYFSKINERESAAYNFTLDESLEIKKHYRRKLKEIASRYKGNNDINPINSETPYIHSLGFIHGNIGDLHFYDQEYDDAIVEFKEAVQLLRQKRGDEELTIDQLVVLTRLFLKLTISFEKKKSYASAYLTCENLIELIYQYAFCTKTKNDQKDIAELRRLSRESVFTTVGMLFQPFIAMMHIKEKEKSIGLSQSDIETIEDQLEQFTIKHLLIRKPELHVFRAEYKNKLGDLLYYKNYPAYALNKHKVTIYTTGLYKYYAETLESFLELEERGFTISRASNLAEETEYWDNILNNSCWIYQRLLSRKKLNTPLKLVANNISDIGDMLFAICSKKCSSDLIRRAIGKTPCIPSNVVDVLDNQLGNVINLYRYAAAVYELNDDPKKASFQYLKILYVIEKWDPGSSESNKLIYPIFKNVLGYSIKLILNSYSSSSLTEAMRIRSIFKKKNFELFTDGSIFRKSFGHIPAFTEMQDFLSVFYMICLKNKSANLSQKNAEFFDNLTDERLEKYQRKAYKFINLNMGSMLSRIIKLQFKSKLNEYQLRLLFRSRRSLSSANLNDVEDISPKWMSLYKYLIADSIYCQSTIIRILKTCGPSYLTSHSLFAEAFYKKGQWCRHLEFYQKVYEKNKTLRIEDRIIEKVKKLIRSRALDTVYPEYNFQKALKHFTLMEEMHNQGFAYHRIIENMYYLNDDFDDDNFHFYAAFDRHLINNELVSNQKNRINDYLEELSTEESRFNSRIFV
ncbi:MAG: ATP-binding protein [Cyclobacteriaceae bacterium]